MTAIAEPPTSAISIVNRCENWADAYRMRMRYAQANSFEGRYRSGQGQHWFYGSAPPQTPLAVDVRDAAEVNGAWQAIPDGYHQFLLGAHYVRKWSPDKCVREAREFAGYQHIREPVSDAQFAANIGMAHNLLLVQLSLPAVFRRERLEERVRLALDLDVWLAGDMTTGDPSGY